MSKRAKFVLVTWVGQNVSVMKKAKMSTDKALLKDIIQVSASWWIHGLFEARPFVFLTIQDTVVLQCTTVRWKFHPFNQSKYNAALKIAKLFCHWLIYLYKDELSIVWRCAGKKPDGIDFMSFSCQLSCGALSLKCWKFEKSLVCNCIPLFLWSFGFEYQSLELHKNTSKSFLFKLQFQKAPPSLPHPNFWRICIVLYIGEIPIVFVPHCSNLIIITFFLVRILLTILKNSVFICSFWQKISKWTPNTSILSIFWAEFCWLNRKTVEVRLLLMLKHIYSSSFQNMSVEFQLENHGEFSADHFKLKVDKASGAQYGTGVNEVKV